MASAGRTVLLSPGLAGRHWQRDSPEKVEITQASVLSLIQLPLKASLGQQDSSIPTEKILESALEYVSTIPGRSHIFLWGAILENPSHMICFVQWSSNAAWHDFQRSMGFGMLFGCFGSNPLNRALQVQLPDFAKEGTVVEAITFTLPADISNETKDGFEAQWANILRIIRPFEPISSCGGWLERDVPRYNPTGPNKTRFEAECKFATEQPYIYVCLVEWASDEYLNLPNEIERDPVESEALIQSLSSQFNLAISRVSIQLSQYDANKNEPGPVEVIYQPKSTESLLKLPISRKYNPERTVLRKQDFVAIQSIKDVHSRQREFSLPYGHCWPMGDFNQYSVPDLATVPGYHNGAPGIFDVVWLYFKPDDFTSLANLSTSVGRSFRNFRALVKKETSCTAVRWSWDQEIEGLVNLVVCWDTLESRTISTQRLKEMVSNFPLAKNLRQLPIFQTFPSFTPLIQDGWLEIVTFLVPKDMDVKLFEHAFYSFQMTTLPGGSGLNLRMCVNAYFSGGWEISDDSLSNAEINRFTTAFHWISPQARAQWYAEFADGAMQSYERLGWMIDLLQIVTVGAESRFLQLMPKND
ncbi:hypothetical protein IFR05_015678 [Cadophora sp. M221]|nr:hypothetical protein IFR05_015678 [Cadophora sp. M221]